jgi:aminoglycoside phosphotransferase
MEFKDLKPNMYFRREVPYEIVWAYVLSLTKDQVIYLIADEEMTYLNKSTIKGWSISWMDKQKAIEPDYKWIVKNIWRVVKVEGLLH